MTKSWSERIAGLVILGSIAWYVGWGLRNLFAAFGIPVFILVVILGAVLGLLLGPFLIGAPLRWLERRIEDAPFHVVLAGTAGLVFGLGIGALLTIPLARLPGFFGTGFPLVISVVTGFLGVFAALARAKDLAHLVGTPVVESAREGKRSNHRDMQILLDTSAIIDGRIADIGQTGFLQGTMLIPRFILDELRHIADSSDSLRRNRGRRGLEMLNKLRKDARVPLQVIDTDIPGEMEVDSKLVRLARNLQAFIATTDFNLNRVAELQGVRVLNINELANALKPVVLPGEDMSVRVLQEGKEVGQGIAFLDDGTMVVVEGGKRFIGSDLGVTVTRILQTSAGRIIFAQPRQ